ncbi:MAG: hypothetical protein AAFP86_17095 [Planctomycetota bacterium]
MRSRNSLLALALGLPSLLLAAAAAPQDRGGAQETAETPEPAPKSFADHVADATAAHRRQHWGASAEALQEALYVVLRERRTAVTAALPSPGEGWSAEERRVDEKEALLATALTGFMVEGRYRGPDGARLTTTVIADSPLAQMLSMQVSNPQFRGENTEVVAYESYEGLLTRNGEDRLQLLVLMGPHTVQVDARGVPQDRLLALFSESALGAVEAAVSR